MLYLNSCHKELNPEQRVLLVFFAIFIFLFIGAILCSRLKALQIYNQAMQNIEKVNKIDSSLIAEKVLLYRRALRLLSKASQLNPYDSRYVFNYAQTLMSIALDENLIDLVQIRGLTNKLSFYELAKSRYEKAICLEPAEADYHLKLGWVYDLLNYTDKAEEEFRKSALLDPTNIIIQVYASKYLLSKDKKEAAFHHLYQAIDLCKKNSYDPHYCSELEKILKGIEKEDLKNR